MEIREEDHWSAFSVSCYTTFRGTRSSEAGKVLSASPSSTKEVLQFPGFSPHRTASRPKREEGIGGSRNPSTVTSRAVPLRLPRLHRRPWSRKSNQTGVLIFYPKHIWCLGSLRSTHNLTEMHRHPDFPFSDALPGCFSKGSGNENALWSLVLGPFSKGSPWWRDWPLSPPQFRASSHVNIVGIAGNGRNERSTDDMGGVFSCQNRCPMVSVWGVWKESIWVCSLSWGLPLAQGVRRSTRGSVPCRRFSLPILIRLVHPSLVIDPCELVIECAWLWTGVLLRHAGAVRETFCNGRSS